MARVALSHYLPQDVINLIQEKLLPEISSYTFLQEVREIYIYYLCFICKKPETNISLKLLLKIYNFSTKDDLIYNAVLYYHCNKCYPLFLMKMMKNQIYVKTK